jgi:hypothetical protein
MEWLLNVNRTAQDAGRRGKRVAPGAERVGRKRQNKNGREPGSFSMGKSSLRGSQAWAIRIAGKPRVKSPSATGRQGCTELNAQKCA